MEDDAVSLTSPITPSSPLSSASPGDCQPLSSKVCGVCGDKALGCNFGATTCESCKAFFRRNALKGKEFRCPFDNSCKIDAITRRFCQKCRLKKCLDIGMKKEFIMSEEERTVKRQKIEENRMKKTKPVRSSSTLQKLPGSAAKQLAKILINNDNHSIIQPVQSPLKRQPKLVKSEAESSFSDSDISASPLLDHSSESFHDCLTPSGPTSVSSVKSSAIPCNRKANKTSTAVQQFPLSPRTPPSVPSSIIIHHNQNHAAESSSQAGDADSLFNGINLDTMDALLNTAIRSEYNVAIDLVRGVDSSSPYSPLSPVRDRQLNEVERGKLQELVVANKALLAPLTEDGPINLHYDSGDPTLLNVINLTDIAIRRIIKMAKKLAAFKTFCQEDQIALLKGGCTELMILRSVMTYDADKGCWKIPHTDSDMNHMNIKVEVLKEARGNVYEEHQRYIQSFEPQWRSDEHIMLLLGAVTLFDPDRPHVIHSDAIRLEQESYYYLLRRYLESTVGGCEARTTYLRLMRKVSELHILNDNHVRVYLDLNPREVEPLLIEIFDLKAR